MNSTRDSACWKAQNDSTRDSALHKTFKFLTFRTTRYTTSWNIKWSNRWQYLLKTRSIIPRVTVPLEKKRSMILSVTVPLETR